MREFRLCLEPESENPLLAITSCRIDKRINEHARAIIKGRIALKDAPRYLGKQLGQDWVKLVCYEAVEQGAMLEILGFLKSKKVLDGLHKLNVLLHYEKLRHLKSFDKIMERLDQQIIGNLGDIDNWLGLQDIKDTKKFELRTMLQEIGANVGLGIFNISFGKLAEQIEAIIGIDSKDALKDVMNYASWQNFKLFLKNLGSGDYGVDDKWKLIMDFVGGETKDKWNELKTVQHLMDLLTAKDWDAFEKALAEEMGMSNGFDPSEDLDDIASAYRHFDVLKQQNALDMLNALNALGYLKSKKILEPLKFLNMLKQQGILGDLAMGDPLMIMKENDFLKKIEQAEILIYGVITRLSLDTKPASRDIYLEIKSGSCLMDVFPFIRTFQENALDHSDDALTYQKVLTDVLSGYDAFKYKEKEIEENKDLSEEEEERQTEGKFRKGTDHNFIIKLRSKRIQEDSSLDIPLDITMDELIREKNIPDFILQYKETDWAFIKRLASHFNTFVLPKYTQCSVKFCFGFSFAKNPNAVKINEAVRVREERKFEDSQEQKIERHVVKSSDEKSETTTTTIAERKTTAIVFDSRQSYEIGDYLLLDKAKYYVCEVISIRPEYENELMHHYTMYQEEFFQTKCPRLFNDALPGASLRGIINETIGDIVKVEFKDDQLPQKKMYKRFPFRTPYSNSGTGFYMMPDPKTDVRVMFPTKDEKDGFAVSGVQQEEETPNRMESYENRAITTQEDKSLLLTPTTLEMINIPQEMYIELKDGAGITVKSNQPIAIRAGGAINIQSGDKIAGQGSGAVTVNQGQTNMKLEGGNFEHNS